MMSSATNVELFVRAGRDALSLGGCPLCQNLFLVLAIKSERGPLTFSVTAVNLSKPPEALRKTISRLPAIIHEGETMTDPDEIIQYIDNRFPDPPMTYDNSAAAEACRDVFSRFSFFIKDVSHSPASLLTELERLNTYLQTSGHRYLTRDDYPDHLDCILLPKLQHIRVAASTLRDFNIPVELHALWRYLRSAYESDVFLKTCPSDQQILHHWLDKPECRSSLQKQQLLTLLETAPTYSFNVPDNID